MRLTDIFKTLFDSTGEDLYLGGTRLDGLIIDREGESIDIRTIDSVVDDSNLRISRGTSAMILGTEIGLIASSSIAFDSYAWTISGDATFVGGVDTGVSVAISSIIEGENIITLTGMVDGETRVIQDVIRIGVGTFAGSRIVGPDSIEDTDAVWFIVDCNVVPDTITWTIDGDASLSDGANDAEKLIAIGESGEDIILTVELAKASYENELLLKSVEINKCSVAGTLLVERPFILSPINTESLPIHQNITIGEFVGENIPALIRYQIVSSGDGFFSPLKDAEVTYATEFYIDIDSLSVESNYSMRIQFRDNDNNYSSWSTEIDFRIIDRTTVDMHEVNRIQGNLTHQYIFDSFSSRDLVGSAHSTNSNCILEDGDYYEYSINLNVTESYIYLPLPSINQNFSMCFRLFPHPAGSGVLTCSAGSGESQPTNYNQWKILLVDDDTRYFNGFMETGSGVNHTLGNLGNVPSNKWYDLMIVVGINTLKVYADGVQMIDTTYERSDSTAYGVYIGNNYNVNEGGDFNIEELDIWKDIQLSSADVALWSEAGKYRSKRKANFVESLTHYWAANTNGSIDDLIGDLNLAPAGATLQTNGFFDNKYSFAAGDYLVGGSAYYTLSGGFSVSILAKFDVSNSSGHARFFDIGNGSNDLNIVLYYDPTVSDTTIAFYLVDAALNIYRVKYDGAILDNQLAYYTISFSSSGAKLFVGTEEIIETFTEGNPALNFDGERSLPYFGKSHWDDGDFAGEIEEIAIFEHTLTHQEIIDWTTKSERPFGGEKLLSLPCAAIDRPVILSIANTIVSLTEFMSDQTFNKIEFQVFFPEELEYEVPEDSGFVTTNGEIDLSMAPGDYKIIARYWDTDGNTSMWSRPKAITV